MTERLSGWEPLPSADWPIFVNALPRPWPKEIIHHDCRWWAARERLGERKFPGRPFLAGRWGCSDWTVREVMQAENWQDPHHPHPSKCCCPPCNAGRIAAGVPLGARHTAASLPPVGRQSAASFPPAAERTNADTSQFAASLPPVRRQSAASFPPRASSSRTDHRSPITEDLVCVPRAPDPSPAMVDPKPPPPPDMPPDAADWPKVLEAAPKAARISRLLLESGLLTVGSVRRLTLEELRGHIGPAHARTVADALEARGTPLGIDMPTPRAGAPPGQPRAGPSNRQAQAAATRMADTRKFMERSALQVIDEPTFTQLEAAK